MSEAAQKQPEENDPGQQRRQQTAPSPPQPELTAEEVAQPQAPPSPTVDQASAGLDPPAAAPEHPPPYRRPPLLEMLGTSAVEESVGLFRSRRPPGRAAAALFRQTTFEYVRLHPKFAAKKSWQERIRLVRSALAFARGKGRVPRIHGDFPEASFATLERPLGHHAIEVFRPLARYFELAAASKQYALLGRRSWSIVESFRALAMAYPVAMWMLRLACGDRKPQVDEVIDVVAMIDRGQSYAPLCGRRHRVRIKAAARAGGLQRLVAWYAR